MVDFPAPIKNLIAAFERLPGVGPKSATRLVFYLLNTPEEYLVGFAKSLVEIKSVKICGDCFNVGNGEVCEICADSGRNKSQICVVERAIDVMALEKVGGYSGIYHVLGGVVNPLEHVGPDDLKIDELISRLRRQGSGEPKEVILATNPTMEGEATALYVKREIDRLGMTNIKISRIGSGLPMGADLEFADQATLSRAMEGRKVI